MLTTLLHETTVSLVGLRSAGTDSQEKGGWHPVVRAGEWE